MYIILTQHLYLEYVKWATELFDCPVYCSGVYRGIGWMDIMSNYGITVVDIASTYPYINHLVREYANDTNIKGIIYLFEKSLLSTYFLHTKNYTPELYEVTHFFSQYLKMHNHILQILNNIAFNGLKPVYIHSNILCHNTKNNSIKLQFQTGIKCNILQKTVPIELPDIYSTKIKKIITGTEYKQFCN